MNKPAGKKKTVSALKSGPKKGAVKNKPATSKAATAKKKVKEKRTASTAPTEKKTRKAAKASAKAPKKTKKLSTAKKFGEESSVPGKKASPTAKTASRRTAKEKVASKTAQKSTPKKTARRIIPSAEGPPKKVTSKAVRTHGPGIIKISKVVVRRELPEEYGENEVILMPVDPNVVFVDWEIRKEEIPANDTTAVTMRIFDSTTDQAAADVPAKNFIEVPLHSRTGSGFFDIGMPGRNVKVEIGFHRDGKFSPILRSGEVPMPEAVVLDELGIAQKLFEVGIPVGY